MPKLYLLGGENVSKRSAKTVNEHAFRDAGEPLDVLVLPWARASFDRKYWKRKLLFDYFLSLGARTVDFVEYSESTEEIAARFTRAKLVYLTGGLPSVLIERLCTMGVDGLLRSFEGVVVGRSAGALALCRNCVSTIRSNSEARIIAGIGLANLTLKAHYEPKNDEALKQFSLEDKIYAVPEGSALVYENDKISFIGTAYTFEKGEKGVLN